MTDSGVSRTTPAHHRTMPPMSATTTPSAPAKRQRSLYDRLEAFISGLTAKYTFAHRLASLIWLPYAFRSGIRIKQESAQTFSAVLPFKKFNRNWYNAMAGASLLANSEIAGGMYIYGRCGGDYTVVCKRLTYDFLRPCFGPAVYRVTPVQDLDALLKTGGEFNFEIELEVVQSVPMMREKRVGKCMATFHVTPKSLHEERAARKARAIEARADSAAGSGGGGGGAGSTEPAAAAAASTSAAAAASGSCA